MNFAAPSHLVRKALGRARELPEAAAEVVVVCPAEPAERPAAFHLPGQIDRVRGYHSMSDPAAEMRRITAGEVLHAATHAFRFDDAVLAGGSLYAGGTRYQMTMDRPPRLPRAVRARTEVAALVGTPVSDIFFGHYVLDDAATSLMAQDFAPAHEVESRHRAGWPHAHEYRRMTGLTMPALGDTRLGTAWVFEDHGMNADRRRRLQDVRHRLARSLATPASEERHGVFLLRGTSGQALRLLDNEAEIAETLAARGFTIVDPMAATATEIATRLSGAGVVVSVEGSALAHAILAMSGSGALITIQPPYRFNHVLKDFTDALGIRYGFVVAEGGRERFRVDPDDVLRTVDLAYA